ncbi:hypothetical protein NA57DRAFT_56050 [Rhizodiscina lignyota]|uniref:Uncharacterized protein n=1 Tax=Rhizodiscina lignyota TaxID=1504668 RepID=A0A9P4M777_9PEZI|nr:hypothetical protein NA57DRAFT_56050 [Rhizodiscina lignyota]
MENDEETGTRDHKSKMEPIEFQIPHNSTAYFALCSLLRPASSTFERGMRRERRSSIVSMDKGGTDRQATWSNVLASRRCKRSYSMQSRDREPSGTAFSRAYTWKGQVCGEEWSRSFPTSPAPLRAQGQSPARPARVPGSVFQSGQGEGEEQFAPIGTSKSVEEIEQRGGGRGGR